MPVTEELKQLVAQMPDPDGRGMHTGDLNKEQIEKTTALIAKGGPANLLGLIEMLGEPGSADNVKPHYALHCVVNYPLVVKDENLRKQFCEVMAEQLSNEALLPYNRAYLCQELQWAGRDEACSALGELLLDEVLTEPAAMALAAIGGERAAGPLRAAAPAAQGKCQQAVLDALAALADPRSADIFLAALTNGDREVRLAGGVGLSKLGSVGSVAPLLKAADCPPGWERVQQTKNCLVLAETLAANGQPAEARLIYKHLRDTRTDPAEQYIRELAAAALA